MIFKRFPAFTLAAFVFFGLFSGTPALTQSSPQFENIIIEAPPPYAQLISGIRSLGGTVTYEYKHIGGIAVKLPRNALESLQQLVGNGTIIKDMIIPAPVAKKP